MQRTEVIRFTVSPQEKLIIQRLAQKAGFPVASFIRHHILKMNQNQLTDAIIPGCVDIGES
jgi:hypothetical protein